MRLSEHLALVGGSMPNKPYLVLPAGVRHLAGLLGGDDARAAS